MRVLVIDTALGACTVGVFDDGGALATRHAPMSKGHSERLAGLARDVMAEAGVGFDSLDRIGVTVGPGSFTGLRVGLAFAQGLGEALDRPVVGISTLAALARSAEADPATAVVAAIDARRGQVYLQTFRNGAGLGAPRALDIDAALQALAGAEPWVGVGTGLPVLIEALAARQAGDFPAPFDRALHVDHGRVVDPSAEALAALTIAADPDRSPPRPLYLRAPDATPPTRLPGQPRPPSPRA